MSKIEENKYSIFRPKSSRGMFMDYPELRKIEAFRRLNNYEMLFVWYFACESSPFYKISEDRKRVEKSLEVAFGEGNSGKISTSDKESMMNGLFSPKLQSAIDEMSKFKVGPRVQALMVTQKNFDNIKKILDIDADNAAHFKNKDDEVDFSKKKAFVDTIAKAQDIMPGLVNQLEGRFNLSKDDEGDVGEQLEGIIDEYHENQD